MLQAWGIAPKPPAKRSRAVIDEEDDEDDDERDFKPVINREVIDLDSDNENENEVSRYCLSS